MGVMGPHCLDCKIYDVKHTKRQEEFAVLQETLQSLRSQLEGTFQAMRAHLPASQIAAMQTKVSQLLALPAHATKMHPYQSKPEKPNEPLARSLLRPRVEPAQTRASLLHLSKCKVCRQQDQYALGRLVKTIESAKEVSVVLGSLLRRLQHQLKAVGGIQQLPHCIEELMEVDIDLDVFAPKLWEQAVSPRFLRRLCKLYTSFDLIVDHQVPLLHYRPDVDRSPFLGELYVGDRYKEFPENMQAPKYSTGMEWFEHLLQVSCRAGGKKSWIELLHEDPSNIKLPPKNTMHHHRPSLQDLTTDERGSFRLYGPATFVVHYNKHRNSFYELCEAVWAHWMRFRQDNPDVDENQVFYWLDVFALRPEELTEPLHRVADRGDLEQVVKHSTRGLLLYMDPPGDSTSLQDVWTRYWVWQATRWLKSIEIARPHQFGRLAFLEQGVMSQARSGHLHPMLRLSAAFAKDFSWYLKTGDFSPAAFGGDDEGSAGLADTRESSREHIMAYRGFKKLLDMAVSRMCLLSEATAEHKEDAEWVCSVVHKSRVRSDKVSEPLIAALKAEAAHMQLAKAYREGQTGAALSLLGQDDVAVTTGVHQMLHFTLLPSGLDVEALVEQVQSIVVSNKFSGDVRCAAGMNVLHYVAMQPRLMLTKAGNVLAKLYKLLLKTGPDPNGQDFWGQTPLNILLISTAAERSAGTETPELKHALAQTIVTMLENGANPSITNVRGDMAVSLGNAFTQQMLKTAIAIKAGSQDLDSLLPPKEAEEADRSAADSRREGHETETQEQQAMEAVVEEPVAAELEELRVEAAATQEAAVDHGADQGEGAPQAQSEGLSAGADGDAERQESPGGDAPEAQEELSASDEPATAQGVEGTAEEGGEDTLDGTVQPESDGKAAQEAVVAPADDGAAMMAAATA